jgi:two-component system CheB/CheR fusion protein
VVIREITEGSLRRQQEQLVAMASHELRTPLTGLNGFLQVLNRDLPPDAGERVRRYATRALEQAQRLNDLVGDLLDVARLQSGKFRLSLEWVDLVPLAARALETAQLLAEGQAIHLDAAGARDAPLPVRGDAVRLEQVLLNLLTNAITHAPETQRIDVRLRREAREAVVEVQDYGPGIAAAELATLFSRFHQVDRTGSRPAKGLGLGLFISKELVTAHGGTIDVRSTEGAGTTFTIRLPLAESASAGS